MAIITCLRSTDMSILALANWSSGWHRVALVWSPTVTGTSCELSGMAPYGSGTKTSQIGVLLKMC